MLEKLAGLKQADYRTVNSNTSNAGVPYHGDPNPFREAIYGAIHTMFDSLDKFTSTNGTTPDWQKISMAVVNYPIHTLAEWYKPDPDRQEVLDFSKHLEGLANRKIPYESTKATYRDSRPWDKYRARTKVKVRNQDGHSIFDIDHRRVDFCGAGNEIVLYDKRLIQTFSNAVRRHNEISDEHFRLRYNGDILVKHESSRS